MIGHTPVPQYDNYLMGPLKQRLYSSSILYLFFFSIYSFEKELKDHCMEAVIANHVYSTNY